MSVLDFSGDASHTYLIYDLKTNEVYYLPIPDGDWQALEYKTTKIVFRWCPKCEDGFIMGSSRKAFDDHFSISDEDSETGEMIRRFTYDETQHRVRITEGFYMSVFPLTQKQWGMITGSSISGMNPDSRSGRWYESEAFPVTFVDQSDSIGIARRLCNFSGLFNFDIPTEAQWEYACRAGVEDDYNWGDNYPRNLIESTSGKISPYALKTESKEDILIHSGESTGLPLGTHVKHHQSTGSAIRAEVFTDERRLFPYKEGVIGSADQILGADTSISKTVVAHDSTDESDVVETNPSPGFNLVTRGFGGIVETVDMQEILIDRKTAPANIAESVGYSRYNNGNSTDRAVGTTGDPVNKYATPNKWGLYHMLDLVKTWCKDAYREDLGEESVEDPLIMSQSEDPSEYEEVVLRGGCRDSVVNTGEALFDMRSSRRHHLPKKYYKQAFVDGDEMHIGVRIVINKKQVDAAREYFVIDLSRKVNGRFYNYFDFISDKDLFRVGTESNPNEYKTNKIVFTRIRTSTNATIGHSSERDNQPRNVNVSAFWATVFPITQKQWKLVMGEFPNGSIAGRFEGDEFPMCYVKYLDCCSSHVGEEVFGADSFTSTLESMVHSEYMQDLGSLEFTLPSEVQWELANRVENAYKQFSTTKYPWGDNIEDGRLWYWANSDGELKAVGTPGHELSGGSNLSDMNGLVSEWCRDWYAFDISLSNGETDFWMSEDIEGHKARAVRGGNWDSPKEETESSHRGARDPRCGWSDVGFRVVINQDIPETFALWPSDDCVLLLTSLRGLSVDTSLRKRCLVKSDKLSADDIEDKWD